MRTAALGGRTIDGKEIAIVYGDSPLVNAIFKEIKAKGGKDGDGNVFVSIEVLESSGGRARHAKFDVNKADIPKQKKGRQ